MHQRNSHRISESSVENESRSQPSQKKVEKIIEAEKTETGRVRKLVGFACPISIALQLSKKATTMAFNHVILISHILDCVFFSACSNGT